jgi:hypothetical protein
LRLQVEKGVLANSNLTVQLPAAGTPFHGVWRSGLLGFLEFGTRALMQSGCVERIATWWDLVGKLRLNDLFGLFREAPSGGVWVRRVVCMPQPMKRLRTWFTNTLSGIARPAASKRLEILDALVAEVARTDSLPLRVGSCGTRLRLPSQHNGWTNVRGSPN